MRTREEKNEYAKGYAAGARHRWPEHRPPTPPGPIVANLMDSLQRLRDAVDREIATFGPDDEIAVRLGPCVDAADAALSEVGQWLRAKCADTPKEGGEHDGE